MGGWITGNVGGWIIGGGVGGGQRVCWPPSQIIGPPPLLTPMNHLSNKTMDTKHRQIQ